MEVLSYTVLRGRLAKALDQVNDDRTPIIITRRNGRAAVLMSLEEYRSWEETLHLLRSPANAERLNRAVADVRRGKVTRRALLPASSGRRTRGRTTSGGASKTRRSSRASTR